LITAKVYYFDVFCLLSDTNHLQFFSVLRHFYYPHQMSAVNESKMTHKNKAVHTLTSPIRRQVYKQLKRFLTSKLNGTACCCMHRSWSVVRRFTAGASTFVLSFE